MSQKTVTIDIPVVLTLNFECYDEENKLSKKSMRNKFITDHVKKIVYNELSKQLSTDGPVDIDILDDVLVSRIEGAIEDALDLRMTTISNDGVNLDSVFISEYIPHI